MKNSADQGGWYPQKPKDWLFSDLLKPHAQFTITSCRWPNIEPITSKMQPAANGTRAKRLHMPKVSIFKKAVANANFTRRTPFLSYNRTLLAFKTSKQETVNLQVCTGARISRKFAAIMQESRSFWQIRASPFSVFMFDFRMKRK